MIKLIISTKFGETEEMVYKDTEKEKVAKMVKQMRKNGIKVSVNNIKERKYKTFKEMIAEGNKKNESNN